MKAYRVNIIGTQEHYLVTVKQKQTLDAILTSKSGNSAVQIGGDTIRLNAIRSLTKTDVDPDCCPAYFQDAVKREKSESAESTPGYRKLPTHWLIVKRNGEIVATNASRRNLREAATALAKKYTDGYRFYLAKCHCVNQEKGSRQYYTGLDQIPLALELRADKEGLNPVVCQLYRYAQPQLLN